MLFRVPGLGCFRTFSGSRFSLAFGTKSTFSASTTGGFFWLLLVVEVVEGGVSGLPVWLGGAGTRSSPVGLGVKNENNVCCCDFFTGWVAAFVLEAETEATEGDRSFPFPIGLADFPWPPTPLFSHHLGPPSLGPVVCDAGFMLFPTGPPLSWDLDLIKLRSCTRIQSSSSGSLIVRFVDLREYPSSAAFSFASCGLGTGVDPLDSLLVLFDPALRRRLLLLSVVLSAGVVEAVGEETTASPVTAASTPNEPRACSNGSISRWMRISRLSQHVRHLMSRSVPKSRQDLSWPHSESCGAWVSPPLDLSPGVMATQTTGIIGVWRSYITSDLFIFSPRSISAARGCCWAVASHQSLYRRLPGPG